MAEASVSRHAAITIDGMTYPCANRIKIDPAEIPITRKINTIIGKKVEF